MEQVLLFLALGVVFYFFMIKPQYKKQKEQKKFLKNLKKGDKIITTFGAIATVYDLDEEFIILELDSKGSKLTVVKESVQALNTKK